MTCPIITPGGSKRCSGGLKNPNDIVERRRKRRTRAIKRGLHIPSLTVKVEPDLPKIESSTRATAARRQTLGQAVNPRRLIRAAGTAADMMAVSMATDVVLMVNDDETTVKCITKAKSGRFVQ